MLINQSLVKDLIKYKEEKLCGLLFENTWINKQFAKGTKSNNLGHYFEYLCTGALAKGDSEPPEPDRTKKGELTSEFKVAKLQAEYFHEVIKGYDIELTHAGNKVIAEDKWVGTLDIQANWSLIFDKYGFERDPKNVNDTVVIDLKFSGLLEDKWSDFGWHLDWLPKKWGTMLQAKHYKFLFWKKYGYNPPFFFFVFDTKHVRTAKIIHVDITTEELMEHEIFLEKAKIYLKQQMEKGFQPIPEYEQCKSCPYKSWCTFKTEIPPILTVTPE